MNRSLITSIASLLISLSATGLCLAQGGPGPHAALPTVSAVDARMLSVTCSGLSSIETALSLTVGVPPGEASFTLSIFDGDTGGSGPSGESHWDSGTTELIFNLYSDPLREYDQSAGNLVGSWLSNSLNGTSGSGWTASAPEMPDNDWWSLTVEVAGEARAPSGHAFYHLLIDRGEACEPNEVLASDFKLAVSNPATLSATTLTYEASLRDPIHTGPIVYENFDPLTILEQSTTYDGTFTFAVEVADAVDQLDLYDGDLDFGTDDSYPDAIPSGYPLVSCDDNDDPDTPADYSDFPFTVGGTVGEQAYPQGLPADDSAGDIFRRGEPGDPARRGCVRLEVTAPDDAVYEEDNPSSDQEIERLRIVGRAHSNPFDPSVADHTAATDMLPAGIWQYRLIGLDLSNIGFLRAEGAQICSLRNGAAACPGPVAIANIIVFEDRDGSGMPSFNEEGIPGVTVHLYRETSGNPTQSAVSGLRQQHLWKECISSAQQMDPDGLACIPLHPGGSLRVEVAEENFEPGGALEGYESTGVVSQELELEETGNIGMHFGFRRLPEG